MPTLREYLQGLEPAERDALAAKADAAASNVRQIAAGTTQPGVDLAIRLWEASGRAFSLTTANTRPRNRKALALAAAASASGA